MILDERKIRLHKIVDTLKFTELLGISFRNM